MPTNPGLWVNFLAQFLHTHRSENPFFFSRVSRCLQPSILHDTHTTPGSPIRRTFRRHSRIFYTMPCTARTCLQRSPLCMWYGYAHFLHTYVAVTS